MQQHEFSQEAIREKEVLRKASMDESAHIEVKLLIRNMPAVWEDRDVFFYFKRFANILEARIIRESSSIVQSKLR